MKDKIRQNINDAEKLEQLYRDDRKAFGSSFEEACLGLESTELMRFWRTRLNYDKTSEKDKQWGLYDILIPAIACLISGFLIKSHDLFDFSVTESGFYSRNALLIVFFGLTIYAVWLNRIFTRSRLIMIILSFLIPAVYVNLLPDLKTSSSVTLIYIHLPLLMWLIYGLVYINFDFRDKSKRIWYIRYNGDLAIITAILVITGGLLTGITFGLFQAINIDIENFYINNIVLVGAVSVPVVATFIIKNYPSVTNKIAPVVARIFSPLVLLTAVVYLAFLAATGKSPYNDRDFLIIFNIMLVGVMAVIIFSVSEISESGKDRFFIIILFILSALTVVIDLIALSAIFYRLSTFGMTPNRLAVIGSNLLILVNLIIIIGDLFKAGFRNRSAGNVGLTIAGFLPVYAIWIIFVIFGIPLIFGMK